MEVGSYCPKAKRYEKHNLRSTQEPLQELLQRKYLPRELLASAERAEDTQSDPGCGRLRLYQGSSRPLTARPCLSNILCRPTCTQNGLLLLRAKLFLLFFFCRNVQQKCRSTLYTTRHFAASAWMGILNYLNKARLKCICVKSLSHNRETSVINNFLFCAVGLLSGFEQLIRSLHTVKTSVIGVPRILQNRELASDS